MHSIIAWTQQHPWLQGLPWKEVPGSSAQGLLDGRQSFDVRQKGLRCRAGILTLFHMLAPGPNDAVCPCLIHPWPVSAQKISCQEAVPHLLRHAGSCQKPAKRLYVRDWVTMPVFPRPYLAIRARELWVTALLDPPWTGSGSQAPRESRARFPSQVRSCQLLQDWLPRPPEKPYLLKQAPLLACYPQEKKAALSPAFSCSFLYL